MSSHQASRSYGIARGTVLAALALTTFAARLAANAPCVTTLADTGPGSLRACIAAANTAANGQTINFDPSLIGGTITVGTPLVLTASMTISGLGPNLLTISGGGTTFIFEVQTVAGPGVTISGVTLAEGNSAGNPGGAIQNEATLTVNNVTFSFNYAGAIATGAASLTVTNSTFYSNTAFEGGGIDVSSGTAIVTNSTFYGNSATISGGAIYNFQGTLTVNNSTISGNSGGGIVNGDGTVTLNDSIVSGNTGGDCTNCGAQTSTNLIGGAPQLAPLGWYGGSTQTMLPLPGSQAIGKGTAAAMNPTNMDQRGFARATSGTIDVGAVQTNYEFVTTTQDLLDMTPDCTSGTGSTCSLRDALTSAAPGGTDIAFVPSLAGGIITLLDSSLPISRHLDLVGPGANLLTVSGGGSTAVGTVFFVTSAFTAIPANAAISGITIANGNSGQFGLGGGIYNTIGSTLTVNNSAFFGGSAGNGGGLCNDGTLAVYNSTFSGNTSPTYGGGIFNGGTLVVTNSTFSGNSAISGGGGGIYNSSGTLAVTNSTFSGNTSGPNEGGGISSMSGTLTVNNSILTSDTGGECIGTGCPSNGVNGNVVDPTPAQPNLAPLGWYGGPTQTMLPLPASEGVCAGSLSLDPGGLTTDQRGFARTNLMSGCLDAGAVQTNFLIVTTVNDISDTIPPAACDATGDPTCSLRDALRLANPLGADIAFGAGVTGTINLSTINTPLTAIAGNLDLFGPGANILTISGGHSSSVSSIFSVNSGANAALSGVTIANGNAAGGGCPDVSATRTKSNCAGPIDFDTQGGGTLNNGSLTVSNAVFSGNAASDNGGGINNNGTLAVIDSTVSGNNATLDGGGIFNNATLTLTNSTVSGNMAYAGAGIATAGDCGDLPGDDAVTGPVTVDNSTISGNTAGLVGGGIGFRSGTLTLTNSIVAGNTTNNVLGSDDCDGCGMQSSYNLIGGTPQLAALGSYGGPLQTMLPLPGSPAICAGSPALDPAGLPTDERGFPRLNTSYTGFSATTPCLDLGADQTNYQVQFAKPNYSGKPGVAVSTPADPVVSVTENGQSIGGVPLTLSFMGTQPTSSSGLGPVTTVAGTGATFKALKVTPGGDYTLLSSLAITPSVSTSGTAALDIASPAMPPTISKAFMPTSIVVGGTSTLSFSINNPNASQSLSGVFFRDIFPTGMQVAATPNLTNTCGGTFTATAGATVVRLNGGSLAGGASCTLSVLVKGTTPAILTNITEAIVSTPGGTGETSNSAGLTVSNPIKLVQDASINAGVVPSTSLAFPSSNTAGNFIAVVVRAGVANETITVRDSAGNMYLKAVQLAAGGSPGGENLSIFYAQNIGDGANTVTVSQTTPGTLRIAILEYSGVATSNALDKTSSAQGRSAAPNAGGLTTTTSGDLLLAGILTVDPEIYTPGTAYTAEAVIPGEPNTKLLVEQRIQINAGPAGGGATLGSADPWAAVLAAFHPASSQCVMPMTTVASVLGGKPVSNPTCIEGPAP